MFEITTWALVYVRNNAIADLQSALYFSAVTYTTTGYGDVVLPREWRLVGAVEALTGILMCGWSTGVFFAVVSRMSLVYDNEVSVGVHCHRRFELFVGCVRVDPELCCLRDAGDVVALRVDFAVIAPTSRFRDGPANCVSIVVRPRSSGLCGVERTIAAFKPDAMTAASVRNRSFRQPTMR